MTMSRQGPHRPHRLMLFSERTNRLAARSKLLWVGRVPVPHNVRRAAGADWELTPYDPAEPLGDQLAESPLAVVHADGAADDPRQLGDLLDTLDRTSALAVVLLPADARTAWAAMSRRRGQFICCSEDAGAEELSAKLSSAASLQPTIENLRSELASARATSTDYQEMDEEMRFAARLQRDFLPRRLPEVGHSRFAVLYRPASWVSGDIYDIVRLDETHVGFYVADAVGHGMPAALLTMFIKKALQMKRIVGHNYQIVPPNVSMAELNADICEQNLTSCQFCTAVYCVLDTEDLTLTYTRAGHPEPVLIRAGGGIERLTAPGSLLGVLPDETFESAQVRLSPGDRLVLFSDGAEPALNDDRAGQPQPVEESFRRWIGTGRDEMLLQLTASIDACESSPRHQDDITVLVMDIEPALTLVGGQ